MSKGTFMLLLVVCMLVALSATDALASDTVGGLPFDNILVKIKNSVTGRFATVASLVGIIAAGATLIFGGDLNGFFRSMLFIVLVVAIIILSNNFLSAIGTGALVTPDSTPVQSIG